MSSPEPVFLAAAEDHAAGLKDQPQRHGATDDRAFPHTGRPEHREPRQRQRQQAPQLGDLFGTDDAAAGDAADAALCVTGRAVLIFTQN